MVSADVALKASMYFWMMMFIGYVAATNPSFACAESTPPRAFATIDCVNSNLPSHAVRASSAA